MNPVDEVILQKLYTLRTLRVAGEVTYKLQGYVASGLMSLSLLSKKDSIIVQIDSYGGDIGAGMMIHDAIRHAEAPVHGLVTGDAGSAAFRILQACDRRIAYPHARLIFHGCKPIRRIDGGGYDEYIGRMKDFHERMLKDLAKRSGQPIRLLRIWSREERQFWGYEALDLGFVDALADLPDKHAK